MSDWIINGRSVAPSSLVSEMQKQIAKNLCDELHARLSSIRHPNTGEFPVVVARGYSLANLYVKVEASPALISLIETRMNEEDLQHVRLSRMPPSTPKVFLSYAGEDAPLAERIARGLMANGIDVWWAEWSINPGDSLTQKIDEGLASCTHFVVLLTPISISKPWVKVEIDAGLVRKVTDRARFIPLRAGLPVLELTPLLQSMQSPSFDDFDVDLKTLVHAIHEISRKPALGAAPVAAQQVATGYSPAATTVAKIFDEGSEHGLPFDLQLTREDLVEQTSLSEEDVIDALHELRSFIEEEHWYVHAREELFVEFDKFFQAWVPAEDALRVAVDMLNVLDFPVEPNEIAGRYGWSARRLNPAIHFLEGRKLADVHTAIGMGEWAAFQIEKNDATRRFVRSRT